MHRPELGLTLFVRIELLTTAQGGRTRPIDSGYRPICLIPVTDGPDAKVGLCEVSLDSPLRPGESGVGRMKFARAVSEHVGSLLRVGSRLTLAEGTHPIGHAEIQEMTP